MSKLDTVFEDLGIAVFKAAPDTIDSLNKDAKQRVKDLFLELIGKPDYNDYGDWLVDAEKLIKEINEL